MHINVCSGSLTFQIAIAGRQAPRLQATASGNLRSVFLRCSECAGNEAVRPRAFGD